MPNKLLSVGGLGGLGQGWKNFHCIPFYTVLISEPYEFITYSKNKYDVGKSAFLAGAFYPWKCSW